MRRLGMLLMVSGCVWLAMPAQAETWSPPDSGAAPVYCPQQIFVVDMLYGTLGPAHQAKWIAGRNQALAEWGLPFAISEALEVVPWNDANTTSGEAQRNITQCAITIMKDKRSAPGDQGGLVVSPGGGGVILNPWPAWWEAQVGQNRISAVVAHETGHALGFWHGGTGVMSGSSHVNQQERDLARAYYEAQGFVF